MSGTEKEFSNNIVFNEIDKEIERIIHLRKLLIIHSYIYYILCESVITDFEWDTLARELVELQKIKGIGASFYDNIFSDFDGSTGMHLPKEEWVQKEASELLEKHNKGFKST